MDSAQTDPSWSPPSPSRIRSSRLGPPDSDRQPHRGTDPPSTSIYGLLDVFKILQSSPLPGPAVTTGPFEYIGQGGQFIVHKGWLMSSRVVGSNAQHHVAIKRPKFGGLLSETFTMADQSAQEPLKSVSTEVGALTTPALREHPNIVQLLAWSLDSYSVQGPLTLALELASSDLYHFLQNEDGGISYQQRAKFCIDIASGLDAIHDCDFVHGDLKPRNVLVFTTENRLVAKLADFGLSAWDLSGAGASVRLGGTPGWQAPEVEQGLPLTADNLLKTDSYSFGLVAWSTLLAAGDPPNGSNAAERNVWVMSDLEVAKNGERDEALLLESIERTLTLLLHHDPGERPLELKALVVTNGYSTFVRRGPERDLYETGESRSCQPVNVALESLEHGRGRKADNRLPWELSPSDIIKRAFLPSSMEIEPKASGQVLFALFLELTAKKGIPKPESRVYHKDAPLDMLLWATRKGFPPAPAVVLDAFDFYSTAIPPDIDRDLTQGLTTAISTGSILARRHLESRDAMALAAASQSFEANGGYGRFYHGKPFDNPLHSIVSEGDVSTLKDYLTATEGVDLNHPTIHGESPLFLACARGSWEMAVELLDRSATASGGCTNMQLTCLHWLFAFDPSVQPTALTRLLESGADINAKAPQPLPFFHYPFQLPAGTPLHWAVAVQSHTAVQALVGKGANLSIRDGCDPYRHDERVRSLSIPSSLFEDVYSESEVGTEGLSPMDYAAMDHDPFLFELLLSSGHDVQINAVDEEGFTVLHRLSSSVVRRTSFRCPFSFLPFQGSPARLMSRLTRTVVAIKSLGGDLEQLTTSNACIAQAREGVTEPWENYTPLMLAALGARPAVVEALLAAGADVNRANETGITALHCLGEYKADAAEIVRILLSAGATAVSLTDSGVTPLQRAAMQCNVEAIDMLLSHGADIEDTLKSVTSIFQGSSVLAMLARQSYGDYLDESYDEGVGGLIEKWLLLSDDSEKRLRVVTRCSSESGTLLYRFARSFMRNTVAALIRCGAPVNGLSIRYQNKFDADRRMRAIYRETPLDAVMDNKDMYEKEMHKHRHRTLAEHNHICMRADAVISLLKEAGGVRSLEPERILNVPDEMKGLTMSQWHKAMVQT